VDASKSVQVGIRGNVVTLDWRKSSDRMGYRVISIDEYRDRHPEDHRDDPGACRRPAYLHHLDVDCLIPA
jgi:hypothetical protein